MESGTIDLNTWQKPATAEHFIFTNLQTHAARISVKFAFFEEIRKFRPGFAVVVHEKIFGSINVLCESYTEVHWKDSNLVRIFGSPRRIQNFWNPCRMNQKIQIEQTHLPILYIRYDLARSWKSSGGDVTLFHVEFPTFGSMVLFRRSL